MAIKNIVLDFDGTCTQIPAIYKEYLERYLIEFNKRVFSPNPTTPEDGASQVSAEEWKQAQDTVRKNSPKAGWTLAITSSAPAAADPYILAFESAKFILRNRKAKVSDPPFEAHRDSNEAHEAPWRAEAREVFEKLLKKNINIYFISNSSSVTITRRLKELLEVAELPKALKVQSDAAKFRVSELPLILSNMEGSLPENVKSKFEAIPPVHPVSTIGRPVHLRRGHYFSAIYAVLGSSMTSLEDTVFCGDIWEMDLAMPCELGAKIHLIKRAAPFDTYSYELDAVTACKGKISENLEALLEW